MITVGLVSAGLLTLRQAIGIVMGANIGTTVTSFIIGFKLGDYALPMLLSERFVSSLPKIVWLIMLDESFWCRWYLLCPQLDEWGYGTS